MSSGAIEATVRKGPAVAFELTEARLREVVAGRPVGDRWPYAGGSERDIEAHLGRAVGELRGTRRLRVEAEFGHYGSGYASYVHVFCAKGAGRSTERRGDLDHTDGLSVYLARLAPVAAIGPGHPRRGAGTGSLDFLDPERVGESPAGDWSDELRLTRSVLERNGFYLPAREALCAPLPFAAVIPTFLSRGPYRVFDALFYWED